MWKTRIENKNVNKAQTKIGPDGKMKGEKKNTAPKCPTSYPPMTVDFILEYNVLGLITEEHCTLQLVVRHFEKWSNAGSMSGIT